MSPRPLDHNIEVHVLYHWATTAAKRQVEVIRVLYPILLASLQRWIEALD